jgi:hypothetical protein
MFPKRKYRASQAAAVAGAAGKAYAPHNQLAFSTQLRMCSKNGSFMTRDNMEHAPFF